MPQGLTKRTIFFLSAYKSIFLITYMYWPYENSTYYFFPNYHRLYGFPQLFFLNKKCCEMTKDLASYSTTFPAMRNDDTRLATGGRQRTTCEFPCMISRILNALILYHCMYYRKLCGAPSYCRVLVSHSSLILLGSIIKTASCVLIE